MRVALLSNLFPPVVSGSSTQSHGLARALAAAGHEVLVLTSRIDGAWPEDERVDGFRVLRLPALRLPRAPIALNFPWLNVVASPANVRRTLRALEAFRPDVLHVHNHMFDMALLGVIARRRLRVPLAVTIHTVIRHSTPLYDRLLTPLDRHLLGPAVVRQADLVLCPDAEVARYVAETFGDVPRALIRYGIEPPPAVAPDAVQELRRRYALNGHDVIVSVGHCHALRDRRDLIHAMPEVLRRRPSTALVIVGAVGVEAPRRWSRDLGVDRSVVFTDAVPHDAVYQHLGLGPIECHWLNNQEPERTSLGVASLEAMLMGKAVVAAASAAAYGEGVFLPGRDFVFVRPNEPGRLAEELVGLLSAPERCRAIGEQARRSVQAHFSWPAVRDATLEAYEEAIRRHRGAAP